MLIKDQLVVKRALIQVQGVAAGRRGADSGETGTSPQQHVYN